MSRLEQLKAEKARREQERVSQEPSAYPEKQAPTTSLGCLLYTSPSPRDRQKSRMPSSA